MLKSISQSKIYTFFESKSSVGRGAAIQIMMLLSNHWILGHLVVWRNDIWCYYVIKGIHVCELWHVWSQIWFFSARFLNLNFKLYSKYYPYKTGIVTLTSYQSSFLLQHLETVTDPQLIKIHIRSDSDMTNHNWDIWNAIPISKAQGKS